MSAARLIFSSVLGLMLLLVLSMACGDDDAPGARPAGSGGVAGQLAAGSGGAAGLAAGSGGVGRQPSARCGTRGGSSCAATEFCNFEPDLDCGATDRGGACESKPGVCAELHDPVCGCDGRNYTSACEAHRAGVSVASAGACARGETCGGFAGLQCASGEFCNYEIAAGGQGCDGKIADAAGVCAHAGVPCPAPTGAGVCGCDRHSYQSECVAHAAGASVLHASLCTTSDCLYLGGRPVAGIGPAPMCEPDEENVGAISEDDGSTPLEGKICCVKS